MESHIPNVSSCLKNLVSGALKLALNRLEGMLQVVDNHVEEQLILSDLVF